MLKLLNRWEEVTVMINHKKENNCDLFFPTDLCYNTYVAIYSRIKTRTTGIP